MQGWAKIAMDTANEMQIQYSLGRNDSCDGLIIYDKKMNQYYVKRMSHEAEDWTTRCFIHGISEEIAEGVIWHQKSVILFSSFRRAMVEGDGAALENRIYGC